MADIIPMRGGAAPAAADSLLLVDLDPDVSLPWPLPENGLSPLNCHDAALEGLIARASVADPEGPEHARRVGLMAAELASAMGIPQQRCRVLQRAAALHDLGKLALPDAILGYRHVLDTTRRRVVEQHALFGAAMLAGAREPWLRLAHSIALCHHERWDGTGYPANLAGTNIPLAARLVMVADVYDALRSVRSYKASMPHEEAMRRMLEGDDRIQPGHFDPTALKAMQGVAGTFADIHDNLPDAAQRRTA